MSSDTIERIAAIIFSYKKSIISPKSDLKKLSVEDIRKVKIYLYTVLFYFFLGHVIHSIRDPFFGKLKNEILSHS